MNFYFYLVLTLNSLNIFSSGIYDGEIKYWQAEKKQEKLKSKNIKEPKKDETQTKKLKGFTEKKFSWKDYQSPKNDEFFKEGNHIPPKPFLELVRNPSDKNIKHWFDYIALKNKLSTRLQNRIKEYVAKNTQLKPSEKDIIANKVTSLKKIPPDRKEYRFRFYFDSKCPHCKRMYQTMNRLQQMGFFVEAKQVDKRLKGFEDLRIPVTPASREEVKKQGIKSTPTLLIGDLKNKIVFKLPGFQTVESIFSSINNKR